MAINITMPALSPTMEEGTLAKWLVKEGDTVSSGDIIAEIETDKATMEVEAVDEGTVAKILIDAGTEGVKVNEVIAVLAEEGEDAASVQAPAKSDAPKDAAPAETSGPAKTDEKAAAPPPDKASATVQETSKSPLPSANAADGRIKASPLARRIADMKGLDLSALKGTGPRGRIIKRDVESAKASPAGASAGAVAQPDGLILPQVLDDRVYAPDSYELVPLDGMRKTVAKRLTTSFMQVPHFPLNIDLSLDHLLASRAAINAAAPEGVKVSVNDMLIKAAAMALIDEPDCNASYTFSISNLGMFGIKSFASIINPPEGMILSVGAGEKRAVVNDKGEVVARTVMTVTLTCDHRVIGGAEGAIWLQAFKRYVETPEAMLL